MRRLLVTVLGTLAILAIVDQGVRMLPGDELATERVVQDQRDAYRRIVDRRFRELRANVDAVLAARHRRWESIPDAKERSELRVFLVGNSAGMFSIVPQVLEASLADAYPHRDVSVVSLMLPGATVVSETVLIRAAVAKGADVIVLTPNLKGLVPGPVDWTSKRAERWFGAEPPSATSSRPADVVRTALHRHWAAYRARFELRGALLQVVEEWTGGMDDTGEIAAALAAISRAAAHGDVAALVETYEAHHMGRLIGTPAFRRRLPETSPVFDTVAGNASLVRDAGVIGVAVFLPVNPIFRDAEATAGFPRLRIDDAYVRRLAGRTLAIYRAAGFATADGLDALPASAFIDLVHVNADGTRAFSRTVASLVRDAAAGPAPRATRAH